LGSRQVG